mmetsp:Transcript_68461/g.121115  ORF Transcript_68461/g.121115 Transcript_68461/m.121115 type:complete len:114 (+) Transcript_68461:250-591(+)
MLAESAPQEFPAVFAAISFRFKARAGNAERAEFSYTVTLLLWEPSQVLDYSQVGHGDRFWGGVLGMRDEIREIAPGLLLGLGSMLATGGVRNCSPFVLHNPRVLDARAPGKSE